MENRTCKVCNEEKEIFKFEKHGKNIAYRCKDCRNKTLRTGKPNLGRYQKGHKATHSPFVKGHIPANKGKYTSIERWSVRNKIWRKEVLERDGYKCTKCGLKEKIATHHIKCWKDYPDLRFEVSNGVTLCVYCHGAEEGPLNANNGIKTQFKKGHKLSKESIEKMKMTKKLNFLKKQEKYGRNSE